MIIDSSALVAILRLEPEALPYLQAMKTADARRLSAGNYLGVSIVIDKNHNPVLSRELDELIRDANITIEPVTEEQVRIARDAYRDFGKGSGHAAGLNFGDCFAYALARAMREPLLYKGDDFSETDVMPAV